MNNPSIRPYRGILPQLAEGVYIDPASVVSGDVTLGRDCSVWPLVAIRGDVNHVRIGDRSNVQEGTVIHVSRGDGSTPGGFPTTVGEDVTIGHKAMVHGCTIGNRVLIGMGAIILDGAVIEEETIVAAGALVTPGKHLESGYVYAGSPAKRLRPLRDSERAKFVQQAAHYVELKNEHMAELDMATATASVSAL